MYTVVRPLGESPELRRAGFVISRHRTIEAAKRAIETETRRMRRTPGNQHSWLDRAILDPEGDLVE